MLNFTTQTLLAQVKRYGHFPTNQNTFQDSDLLDILDESMRTYIVPMLMAVREGYFTRYKDYTIDPANGVYPIPERAIGSRLGDVQLVIGNYIEQLRLINIGQLDSQVGSPVGARAFTVQGNNIVLIPVPTSGTLRVYYHTRPSSLVKTTDCGQIISIDTNLNQVVCGSLPASFNLSSVLDLVKNASGFDTLQEDATLANLTGTTLTFNGALPTGLQVGDWVCLAQQSPIPQIPVEIMPLLVQKAVVKIYEIQGDQTKSKLAAADLVTKQEDLMKLVTPRIEEAPKVINPPNNDVTVSTRFGFNRFRRY